MNKTLFLKTLCLVVACFATLTLNAQWTQGAGIYGGTATALASAGTTVYVGTPDNGIYYTTNSGQTWTQTSLNAYDVQAIAISGSYIYAGLYDDGTGSPGIGVYLSTDNGATWAPTSLNDQTVWDIDVLGSLAVAAGDYGVYVSTDNGSTWTQTTLPAESFLSVAIDVVNGYIYAGHGYSGVYKSTDNGLTWTQVMTITDNDSVMCLYARGSIVLAGTYAGGIFRSTNGGSTWTQTALNYQEIHAIHAVGDNIYAGAIYDGVFVSPDNGATWDQTSMDTSNVDALTSIGNTLFAGTWGGGVFATEDSGDSWTRTALQNDDVRAFVTSGNNVYAASASNGIYKSTDNGHNWTHQALENTPLVSMGTHNSYLFAGADYGGIYRSADGGETWASIGNLGFQSVYAIASDDTAIFAATLVYSGAGKILKSTNNGSTWTQKSTNQANTSYVSFAVSGTNIYAGTFYLNMSNIMDPTRKGVYMSVNGGNNWTQTTLNNVNVWSLAANDSYVFAGTYELFVDGSGVYRSADNGATWQQTTLNLGNVASLKIVGTKIYAGTNYGVYVSEDNGDTWTLYNEGFVGTPLVYGLHEKDGFLHAGTATASAWFRNTITQLETPVLSISPAGVLSWNAVDNASEYVIYKSDTPDGGFARYDATTMLTWQDPVTADQAAFYYVTAATMSRNESISSRVSRPRLGSPFPGYRYLERIKKQQTNQDR
jgi:hypothetical protein